VAQLTGGKLYSSRANQAAPQACRIPRTIPGCDYQKANRARRAARAGRPPAFGRDRYKLRNQGERLLNRRKQSARWPPLRQTRRPPPGHDHDR